MCILTPTCSSGSDWVALCVLWVTLTAQIASVPLLTPVGRNDHSPQPVTVIPSDKRVFQISATLISRVKLTTANQLCEQIVSNLKLTSGFMVKLVSQETLNSGGGSDFAFVRRLSYMSLNLERTYKQIVTSIKKSSICPPKLTQEISEAWTSMHDIFSDTWQKIAKTQGSNILTLTVQNFTTYRYLVSPPKPQVFLETLAVGVVASGITLLVNELFSDDSADLEAINSDIHTLNDKILVTNERIDILAKNISTSLEDMKLVLTNLNNVNREAEHKYIIDFNVKQLVDGASNCLLLLKIIDNSLALLRSNVLTYDLFDIDSFRRILQEGSTHFPDSIFPIQDIAPTQLTNILSLIKVEHVSNNQFVMIIPLVHKEPFNVASIIPHPVRIQNGKLMIAEVTELIAYRSDKYIVLPTEQAKTLGNDSYIIEDTLPVWNTSYDTCSLVAFKGNITKMSSLCTFAPLAEDNNIFLTNSKYHRVIYFHHETAIELKCPTGLIRQQIKGTYVIPKRCTLHTEAVTWDAHQSKDISLSDLLTNTLTESPFDLTHLPIYTMNHTTDLHETIKEQLGNINTKYFTFNFTDTPLETIQSIHLLTFGSVTVLVIINTIFIATLCIIHVRNWMRNADKVVLRENLNRLTAHSPFSSLRSSLRSPANKIRATSKKAKSELQLDLKIH